jgi:hypothetical protein
MQSLYFFIDRAGKISVYEDLLQFPFFPIIILGDLGPFNVGISATYLNLFNNFVLTLDLNSLKNGGNEREENYKKYICWSDTYKCRNNM